MNMKRLKDKDSFERYTVLFKTEYKYSGKFHEHIRDAYVHDLIMYNKRNKNEKYQNILEES